MTSKGWKIMARITRQKIFPFLWFENQAEEAVRFYTTIFKKSKILDITRYNEAGSRVSGRPEGSVMTVAFQIEGQNFTALNGGPAFKFSHAISFVVNCENQEEIDHLWRKLSKGGRTNQCGWLDDKYGVTWQIVPSILPKMLQDRDQKRVARVTEAFLKMKKFDIVTLKQAYKGTKA
jgi:predicted 3-demethylubiquinone-9 3-methyltransferase (glyoxalase superfamily)